MFFLSHVYKNAFLSGFSRVLDRAYCCVHKRGYRSRQIIFFFKERLIAKYKKHSYS